MVNMERNELSDVREYQGGSHAASQPRPTMKLSRKCQNVLGSHRGEAGACAMHRAAVPARTTLTRRSCWYKMMIRASSCTLRRSEYFCLLPSYFRILKSVYC